MILKKAFSLAAAFLLCAAASFAQSPLSGIFTASDFAGWTTRPPDGAQLGAGGNTVTWTAPQFCTATSSGYTFTAFKVGTPIRIVDNVPSLSETVIVTSVQVSPLCSIQFNAVNPHSTWYIKTGTGGLQEAINFQLQIPGSVVVVTPGWSEVGGITSWITAASGNSNVSILDERQSCMIGYEYIGGIYVAQGNSCSGGGGGQITLTTNGSSGPSTLIANVLNVPVYGNGTGTVGQNCDTTGYLPYWVSANTLGCTPADYGVTYTAPAAFNFAAGVYIGGPTTGGSLLGVHPTTVSALPSGSATPANIPYQLRWVSDGTSQSDCTVGSGSTFSPCYWTGLAWAPVYTNAGAMVWPGAGVPVSDGTSGPWGTSYAVQGSDSKLLSSGTISGVANLICTDSNEGATTVGCPQFGTPTPQSVTGCQNTSTTNTVVLTCSGLVQGGTLVIPIFAAIGYGSFGPPGLTPIQNTLNSVNGFTATDSQSNGNIVLASRLVGIGGVDGTGILVVPGVQAGTDTITITGNCSSTLGGSCAVTYLQAVGYQFTNVAQVNPIAQSSAIFDTSVGSPASPTALIPSGQTNNLLFEALLDTGAVNPNPLATISGTNYNPLAIYFPAGTGGSFNAMGALYAASNSGNSSLWAPSIAFTGTSTFKGFLDFVEIVGTGNPNPYNPLPSPPGFTPGTFTNTTITVNAQGIITAISTGVAVASITGDPVLFSNSASTGAVTLALRTQTANCVIAGPASGSAATPTCRALVSADIPAATPTAAGAVVNIANTTFTTATTTVNAGTCDASATTVTITGLLTSSVPIAAPSSDLSGVTGWGASGGLTIVAWPSASNTLSYKRCNPTAGNITPGAATFNVGAK